ncbi:MAG: NUDIX domain-containing protein [Planctomycetota bacterium]
MNKKFHNLVRGLAISDGHILVAHAKGAANTFLPGGHIEVGEGAQSALAREIKEEIGYDSRVGKFLGCVEHLWEEGGWKHFEINHIFQLQVSGLDFRTQPKSLESHLELFWLPISDLKKRNLQPHPLIDMITKQDVSTINAWWDSNCS